MKLPWSSNEEELREEIEKLESEIEELEEEKESFKQRFEAEKERRSKLSAKKQELEKEKKKLKQRLESKQIDTAEKDNSDPKVVSEPLEFERGLSAIEKLSAIESKSEDLVTVRKFGELSDIQDLSGLKSSISSSQYSSLNRLMSGIAFLDNSVFGIFLEMRPVMDSRWKLSDSFEVGEILDFIGSEKTWVDVSAGETTIYTEKKGEVLDAERVKNRIDRKHSQGGYSQGRFERKRDEQIEEHLDRVREKLPEAEVLLLGDQRLCLKLDGKNLGGVDRNNSIEDEFYKFRRIRFQT